MGWAFLQNNHTHNMKGVPYAMALLCQVICFDMSLEPHRWCTG